MENQKVFFKQKGLNDKCMYNLICICSFICRECCLACFCLRVTCIFISPSLLRWKAHFIALRFADVQQELVSCVWDTLHYIVDACRFKDVNATFCMSNLHWESYNRWISLIRWGPSHWSGDSSMQWIFDEKVWFHWKIWCGFWMMRHGPDFCSWQQS